MNRTLLLVLLPISTSSFLFGGSSGGGCRQCCPRPPPPRPACGCGPAPPPPPPPQCPPPPPPPNPCRFGSPYVGVSSGSYASAPAGNSGPTGYVSGGPSGPTNYASINAPLVPAPIETQPDYVGDKSNYASSQPVAISSPTSYGAGYSTDSDYVPIPSSPARPSYVPPSAASLNSYQSPGASAAQVAVSAAKTTLKPFGEEDYDLADFLSEPKIKPSGYRRKQAKAHAAPSTTNKCMNEKLRSVIEQGLSEGVSLVHSKRLISRAAKKEFGYNFAVICSNSHFSYLMESEIYCEEKREGSVCLAFKV